MKVTECPGSWQTVEARSEAYATHHQETGSGPMGSGPGQSFHRDRVLYVWPPPPRPLRRRPPAVGRPDHRPRPPSRRCLAASTRWCCDCCLGQGSMGANGRIEREEGRNGTVRRRKGAIEKLMFFLWIPCFFLHQQILLFFSPGYFFIWFAIRPPSSERDPWLSARLEAHASPNPLLSVPCRCTEAQTSTGHFPPFNNGSRMLPAGL